MQIINDCNEKIGLIALGIIISIFIIILRLFYLQVYLNEKLYSLSKKNFTRVHKVISPRGNIVDTNNHLLVTNRPVINIYWQSTGKKQLSPEQNLVIKEINEILNIKDIDEQKIKIITQAEKLTKSVLIAHDITFDQLGKISEKFSNSENIGLSTNFKRYYPHKSFASHVIGYLSQLDSDIIGKMGLEKLFENELKGESGSSTATINSLGKSLKTFQTKAPVPGQTIRTTLDLHLQKIAEEIFPEDLKGSMIVMDPENGAIRVSLSRPNFDPTIFLSQLTQKEWMDIQEKQPFLNRAFSACYPPASIFKLVTVCAALELGLIKEDSIWFCNGYINFVNRKYHCAKGLSHGLVNPQEAIVKSCNTFFFNIAKHMHIDDLADYAKRFGLGHKTGIIFAEKNGLIPTNSWKKKIYGQQWWPGETLSAVIGQSYLLVTPIQVARMFCSIFRGYLTKPRILEDEKVEKTQLNIKKESLEFLKKSMKPVVTSGTGKRIGNMKDLVIYAKTGTAQTSGLEKRDMGNQYLEHAWFVSHFTYKNQKPLTMVIFLEHVGSTFFVINIAKQFLSKYRTLYS